ncbi:hypothetical protein V2J09_015425 [Rumex salicifolius]
MKNTFFFFLLLLSFSFFISAQNVPSGGSTRLTDLFPHLSFTKDAHVIFGAENVRTFNNGSFASISLDKKTGSGLASNSKYYYGFFSTALKLPAGYSSGVVVAFYLSNSDAFPHNHDEIDFELLGHENRKEWILQTNIYGNGSVSTGREEKFRLWFDPTLDNIPIREVLNTKAMSAYPSKPMTVYTTIWDASDWATSGGKYPVDYKYAPFVSSLGKLEMSGCLYNQNSNSQTCPYKGSSTTSSSRPSSLDPVDGEPFVKLSQQQIQGLKWSRSKYMVYSYCNDRRRYKVLPAECSSK